MKLKIFPLYFFFFYLQNQNDFMVICNVAKILELVVPLMDHPSETFLTTIEEDLMKLIIKYGMTVSKESGFTCTEKESLNTIIGDNKKKYIKKNNNNFNHPKTLLIANDRKSLI